MKAIVLALSCALAATGAAAKGKSSNGPPATRSGADNSTIVHGGGSRMGADPRHPPPLAPGRKVVEQDCSKAFDPSAGNLRCK